VFHLAKRTVKYEPREYNITLEEADACEQYAIWAEEAWSEYRGQNPDAATSADYYDGFRNGFVDYCFAGGSGEPPPVPPRRFWRTIYRNAMGDQSIADWSTGFRAGSGAARTGGYRKRAVVPSPSSQYNTLAYEDQSEWQTEQPILIEPEETLDGLLDAGDVLDAGELLDAGKLLDAGPELLITPKPGTSKSKAPATKKGPPVVPDVIPEEERDEDPYLKSPLEDVRLDQTQTKLRPISTKPRKKMLPPANESSLDSVPEIEPNRLRYDDFFRLPDESNAPEGDSANRLDFSQAAEQATHAAEPDRNDVDSNRAAWVLPVKQNKLRPQPAMTDQSNQSQSPKKVTSKRSTKTATEWAKHAQTLFQDPNDIPSAYTPYSGLYSEQP
jgi:hypothetical protein